MNFLVPIISLALGAYLIGSFPAGYLAGRCCGIDLRLHGSGNIGATNVLRVLNKKWGYTVFAIDFMKGFLAVSLALAWGRVLGMTPLSLPGAMAAVAVLLGHSFPVWLGFRGGKGIATSAGIILGLFPAAFLICCGGWILFFYCTRIVSIASIVATLLLPISVITLYALSFFYPQLPQLFQEDWLAAFVSIAMAVLALLRHSTNIKRLWAGTEPRFERNNKNLKPQAAIDMLVKKEKEITRMEADGRDKKS